MTVEKVTFSFGKNWDDFVKNYFSEERIAISKKHILDFLHVDNLKGKYFLDVGCGSGLSSLAAVEAGASQVISFDIDPYSVATTERLKQQRGNPLHWIVRSGSVLDKEFLATIEPADIVYSWGVLHHTGAMWQAIENTMTLVKSDGMFYVALYTTTPQSPYWIKVKQVYNRASPLKKTLMETGYVLGFIVSKLRDRKNPVTYIRNYKRSRGMAFMTDVRDWLGGWPYEDATVEEVTAFFEKHNFKRIRISTGQANTEYLFVRS
jgi:SAM-dependent methyltransferase